MAAGHHYFYHARARLAFDLHAGDFFLRLLQVFLHLLGLFHEPGKLAFHHDVVPY
jgi:hypothetical protein